MGFTACCYFCEETYMTEKQAIKHMKSKHSDKYSENSIPTCVRCDKTYGTYRNLAKHYYLTHRPESKKPCPICNKIVGDNFIKQHMRDMHCDRTNKNFKCDECDFATHAARLLRAHKKNIHDKSYIKHQCETCPRKFRFPYMLREHQELCTGEVTLKCENEEVQCKACDRKFQNEKACRRHFSMVHEPRVTSGERYICDKCGKSFATSRKSEFENHMCATKADLTCDICNDGVTHISPGYLVQHYRSKHGTFPNKYKDRKLYMCDRCPNIYLTQNCLNVHVECSHTETKAKKKKIDRVYPCKHCGKEFATYSNCAEHVRKMHDNITPFQCPKCPTAFGTRGRLNTHITNKHTRMKCDICNQDMCNKFILERHKSSVHGIKPDNVFDCEHCSLFFKTLVSKEKHVAKHH